MRDLRVGVTRVGVTQQGSACVRATPDSNRVIQTNDMSPTNDTPTPCSFLLVSRIRPIFTDTVLRETD